MQMYFIFLYSSLPLMLGILYSILVIVWIVFHLQGNADKDFVYSVAICIGWMYTIAFTSGIRTIHYFWRMIQSMIVKDIFKFLFIYLFVLLAFTFPFHAMFQISTTVAKTYTSPLDTGFSIYNLMIGMREIFNDEFEIAISPFGRTTYLMVIYLIYMILSTILLFNLLIAMLNDSYASILEQQGVT